MIHVQVGMALSPLTNEIHEILDDALLFGPRTRPKGAILVFVREIDAEEIFQAVHAVIRVALDIEIDVAVVRFWEKCESQARLVRQQVVAVALFGR